MFCGLTCAGLADQGTANALVLGVRQHVRHSVATDLPYGDNDISYLLGYEWREASACWQLAVDYAPDVDSVGVDYVLTPQLNLIVNDGIWRGGVGILKSYIADDMNTDWEDIYWQFILGIGIPLGGLTVDVDAFYAFEDWGDIGDFDTDDLEFGASLSFAL